MLYAPLLLCFVLLALSRFLCALHFIFRTLSALQLVCICRSFCSVLFSCALCFRLLALVLPAFLRLALLFYLFRFSRIFLCSFLARFHLALHLFSLFSVFSLALPFVFLHVPPLLQWPSPYAPFSFRRKGVAVAWLRTVLPRYVVQFFSLRFRVSDPRCGNGPRAPPQKGDNAALAFHPRPATGADPRPSQAALGQRTLPTLTTYTFDSIDQS